MPCDIVAAFFGCGVSCSRVRYSLRAGRDSDALRGDRQHIVRHKWLFIHSVRRRLTEWPAA